MPDMPEGTPWWVWLFAILLIVVVGPVSVSIAQRLGEIRKQVQNSHPTNLRDDLDVTRDRAGEARESAVKAASDARLARESAHRTERYVSDLSTSIRALEHSMDRRDQIQEAATRRVQKALDEHLAEVPNLLAQAHANCHDKEKK